MGSHQIKFCSADNRRGQKQKKYQKEGPGEFPSEQVRGNTKGRKPEFNKHCIFYFLLLYCLLLVLNLPPPKKNQPPIWARCGCLRAVWRVFVWTILAVYFLTLVNWGFAKDMVSYRELFCFKGQKDSRSVCSVMSKSLRPITCSRARLLCPLVSPGKNTRVRCHFLLSDLPNPEIKPTSAASAGDSLNTEPPRKPKKML